MHLLRAAAAAGAKSTPRTNGRPIADGEVLTACQAACPTQAIVFGDMNDPTSDVTLAKKLAAQLRPAGRLEHRAANDLSGGAAQSESRLPVEEPRRAVDRMIAGRAGRPDRSEPGYKARCTWELFPPINPMNPESQPTPQPPNRPAARERANAAEPDYVPRGHDMTSVTEQISDIVLSRPTGLAGWSLAPSGTSLALLSILFAVVVYLLLTGVGIWGIDIPVAWGFAITDFVWWIGIGHAGTLISAILLLMHQRWRTSINRIAEAMTIFAVMCAGLFPLLHLGRPWFFYWLLPYPNTMRLWPQFRSALVWDVFAVSTYFIVSLVFWYMGMIPDLATLRDRAARAAAAGSSMAFWPWAGGIRRGTGSVTSRPICCSADWRRRWSSRSIRSSAPISPFRSCPAGMRRSSRPISSPEPFSRASRWCCCCAWRSGISTVCRISSPSTIWT